MFFTAKKLISSLFLTISLSSALFLLPFESKAEVTVTPVTDTSNLDGQSDGTQNKDDPSSSEYTGSTADNSGEAGADTASKKTNLIEPNFGCGRWNWTEVSNCLLSAEYGLIVGTGRLFFKTASLVFDTLWAFGLSSESYKQNDFIGAGWIVCRDISNTFFIFILLYIAITTILQIGGGSKSLLSTLIIVALLMNFSLYITRFVIDIGNMFALEFYSAFPEDRTPTVTIPGIQQHSISSGFQNALVVPLIEINNNVGNANGGFSGKATMILFVGLEFFIVTFVWLISSFLLIGRIATLWIVMILSPIAFFSLVIPSAAGGLSIWGQWKGELIKATFFPAIFLFFMYFAVQLAQNTGFITKTFGQGTETSIMAFIPLFIQFGLIIAFIMFGLKTATGMSGAAGQMAANYRKIGTGLAGGAMLGATAWTSRQSLGRMADWARSDKEAGGLGLGKSFATSKWGRPFLSGLNTISTGNMDVRSAVGSKVGDINFGGAGGKGGFVGGKGGFLGIMQKSEQGVDKKNKDLFDSLKNDTEAQMKLLASLPEGEAARIWKGISSNKREDYLVDAYEKDYEVKLKKINKNLGRDFDTEELKTEFDLWKDEPEKQAKKLEELYTRGKQNQIDRLMEKLTVKERFNAEKKTKGETQEYLKKVNEKRMRRIATQKPKQKETEEKELKDLETMYNFSTSLKDYKKEENADLKKQLAEKVKENLGKLRDEQVTTLKFDDIKEEPVLQRLSAEKLKAIKKKSGSKFTWDEMDQFNELLKNKSELESVRDIADLDPNEQAKAKKTAEGKAKRKSKKNNEGKISPEQTEQPSEQVPPTQTETAQEEQNVINPPPTQ